MRPQLTGARTVTVTTAGGTSGPQAFTISPPPPTLTSVSPNQGIRGSTVAVTLTGTNFVVGATTVTVSWWRRDGQQRRRRQQYVADRQLRARPGRAAGPRTVTVTTAGGTSGAQTFTIKLPAPGSTTFNFTGSPADLYRARRRRQRHDSGHRRAGRLGLGSSAPAGWPGRSDDGDRVRHAGRVAHRACRWVAGAGPIWRPAASTEAAAARESVAAAGAPRACVTAPPRWWSSAAAAAGALRPEAARLSAAGTAAPAVVSLANPGGTAPLGGGGGGGGTQVAGGAGGSQGQQHRHRRNRWRGGSGWNRWRRTSQESLVAAVVAGATSAAAAAAVETPSTAGGGGGGGGSSFAAPGATAVAA